MEKEILVKVTQANKVSRWYNKFVGETFWCYETLRESFEDVDGWNLSPRGVAKMDEIGGGRSLGGIIDKSCGLILEEPKFWFYSLSEENNDVIKLAHEWRLQQPRISNTSRFDNVNSKNLIILSLHHSDSSYVCSVDFFNEVRDLHYKDYQVMPRDLFYEKINSKTKNMKDKKIIGYLCPCDMKGGTTSESMASKGEVFVKYGANDCLYVPLKSHNTYLSIPAALVESTWEPAYEKLVQDFDMGGFIVRVKDGKAYHITTTNQEENITNFVESLISYLSNLLIATYPVTIKDITFSKTGCRDVETNLSDWKAVCDALDNQNK